MTAGLAVVGACLPALDPIKSAPDATDESPNVLLPSGCGDGVIETLDDGGDAGESCDPGDASPAGCEACQVVCSGALDEAGHCYFLAEDTDDSTSARGACERQSAHLVTFSSQREVDFVADFLAGRDAGDAHYWVNLSMQPGRLEGAGSPYGPLGPSEPGWPGSPSPCHGCFAVGADASTNEFALFPDASRADALCLVAVAVAVPDAGWLRVACKDGPVFKTVCERQPAGQRLFYCGGPYCSTVPATAGRKRYVISIEEVTAEAADVDCRSRYGGTLAILDSREEREQLATEIKKLFPQPISLWIGLSQKDGGAWTWDDGQPDDGLRRPRPWGEDQPSTSANANANRGAGRAFLAMPDNLGTDGVRRFDTQLAYSDDDGGAGARRQYVCQRDAL